MTAASGRSSASSCRSISIDAMTASAPSKVALALDRMGLKF